ncbi:PH domain-containing protein [Saliphagus infecundisoli]|uniref:PH domain-containing protein n=1 Tax=Saliphagus infecundisoli TaxID=1849069 RepID=A0ABD5Q9Y7_9EURY|nr:PH domain-containing protein [Saliphagus infecundisoli]
MSRLHPVTALTKTLGYAVQWASVPFFLVSILSGAFDVVRIDWVFSLAPVGFLLGAAYGLVEYYRFEYELSEDTFDLASGVFSRRDREIPFRRVQNVDVSRGIVQRLLGLAVVSIETAGGGDTEATLRYVGEGEANWLQREIRRLTAENDEIEADEQEGLEPDPTERPEPATAGTSGDRRPTHLFELDQVELGLLSLTTAKLSASMVVAVVTAFGGDAALGLVLSLARPFGGPAQLAGASPLEYAALALSSALYGAVATYLVGVVYTFVGYYGFRIGEAGDDLVYERGLLQRYSGSIPTEKIQTLSIVENPLQRAIGYAGLRIETAGYGPDGGGNQSAIPLAKRSRVERFVARATGIESGDFDRPPTVARRRYLVRYSVIAAAIVAAAGAAGIVWGLPYWYASALAVLGAPVGAHLRWTNLGYDLREDHLLVREGFWRRRTHVVPYYRLQTVSTRRSVFQRRLGLASLVIDTASSRTFVRGTPTIHDLSLSTARSIHADCRERLEDARRTRAREERALSVAFT